MNDEGQFSGMEAGCIGFGSPQLIGGARFLDTRHPWGPLARSSGTAR